MTVLQIWYWTRLRVHESQWVDRHVSIRGGAMQRNNRDSDQRDMEAAGWAERLHNILHQVNKLPLRSCAFPCTRRSQRQLNETRERKHVPMSHFELNKRRLRGCSPKGMSKENKQENKQFRIPRWHELPVTT